MNVVVAAAQRRGEVAAGVSPRAAVAVAVAIGRGGGTETGMMIRWIEIENCLLASVEAVAHLFYVEPIPHRMSYQPGITGTPNQKHAYTFGRPQVQEKQNTRKAWVQPY